MKPKGPKRGNFAPACNQNYKVMWKYKEFKTEESYSKWMQKNRHKYRIQEIFVNNVYKAIEYKKLIKL